MTLSGIGKAIKQEWGAALFVGTVILGALIVGLIFLFKSVLVSPAPVQPIVTSSPVTSASQSPSISIPPLPGGATLVPKPTP